MALTDAQFNKFKEDHRKQANALGPRLRPDGTLDIDFKSPKMPDGMGEALRNLSDAFKEPGTPKDVGGEVAWILELLQTHNVLQEDPEMANFVQGAPYAFSDRQQNWDYADGPAPGIHPSTRLGRLFLKAARKQKAIPRAVREAKPRQPRKKAPSLKKPTKSPPSIGRFTLFKKPMKSPPNWSRMHVIAAAAETRDADAVIKRLEDMTAMWRRLSHLSAANLSGLDPQGLDLQKQDLSACRAVATNFSSADLAGAMLLHADLTRADFAGANLRGAKFRTERAGDPDWDEEWADLVISFDDLTDRIATTRAATNVTGATWQGATYDKHTLFPDDFNPTAAGMVFIES